MFGLSKQNCKLSQCVNYLLLGSGYSCPVFVDQDILVGCIGNKTFSICRTRLIVEMLILLYGRQGSLRMRQRIVCSL